MPSGGTTLSRAPRDNGIQPYGYPQDKSGGTSGYSPRYPHYQQVFLHKLWIIVDLFHMQRLPFGIPVGKLLFPLIDFRLQLLQCGVILIDFGIRHPFFQLRNFLFCFGNVCLQLLNFALAHPFFAPGLLLCQVSGGAGAGCGRALGRRPRSGS